MGIAFDAATDGGTVTGTSLTWNHTCTTTSNRVLRVGIVGDLSTDSVTSVIFNSVALNKLGTVQVPSDRFVNLWELLNPASGTHSVVVFASTSIFIAGVSASYTGVTSSEAATTSTANTPTTSVTGTVITGTLNDWTGAMFVGDTGGTISGGSGTTIRINNAGTTLGIGDSNSDLSIGSHTLTGTGTGQNWGVVISAMVPVSPGVIPSSGAYQQEQNTTDRYLLEDGSGVYLIEPWPPASGGIVYPPWFYGDLTLQAPGRFFKDKLNG